MHPSVHAGPTQSSDEGFTLIELLFVVVVIGILVAIAIPRFSNFREGSLNNSAASDVRNGVTVVEHWYGDTEPAEYPASRPVSNSTIVFGTGDELRVSPGNYVGYTKLASGYAICGWNPDGRTLYKYESPTGATTITPNSPLPASC